MGYTFLQKPSSFKFLSNLEENCGADINNGTIKCKFLLTNVSKNGRWASYTFLQKLRSFKFYCILVRRKLCCRHHYWKTFVELHFLARTFYNELRVGKTGCRELHVAKTDCCELHVAKKDCRELHVANKQVI